MRGDLKSSMLSMAAAATMPPSTHPTKPKVDFSIESLVGRSDDLSDSQKNRTSRLTPPPAHSTKFDYSNNSSNNKHGLVSSQEADLLLSRADFEYGARTSWLPPSGHLNTAGIGYAPMLTPYSEAALPAALYSQHRYSPYLVAREYQQAYPWLVARQPRLLPYRPQGHQSASFILHQFRKPKRIRTAFSPSQLLTLEHAFEKNHYVVGAERKQLAQDLNLTETQVKVWFQNRRTKHKRQKQEEEQQGQNSSGITSDGDKEDLRMTSSPMDPKDEDSKQSDCDSRDSSDVSQRSPS